MTTLINGGITTKTERKKHVWIGGYRKQLGPTPKKAVSSQNGDGLSFEKM